MKDVIFEGSKFIRSQEPKVIEVLYRALEPCCKGEFGSIRKLFITGISEGNNVTGYSVEDGVNRTFTATWSVYEAGFHSWQDAKNFLLDVQIKRINECQKRISDAASALSKIANMQEPA